MELQRQRDSIDEAVFRLVPPVQELARVLLRRGIGTESLSEIIDAMKEAGLPQSLTEAIDYSFRPRTEDPTPYSRGRFGDGSYAVFYSAIEEETAIAEKGHHVDRRSIDDGQEREFSLIACRFTGLIVDLLGAEDSYPQLTAPGDESYPACWEIAVAAKAMEADGLHAPSARRPGGVCVPVFVRSTISEPGLRSRVMYSRSGNRVIPL